MKASDFCRSSGAFGLKEALSVCQWLFRFKNYWDKAGQGKMDDFRFVKLLGCYKQLALLVQVLLVPVFGFFKHLSHLTL